MHLLILESTADRAHSHLEGDRGAYPRVGFRFGPRAVARFLSVDGLSAVGWMWNSTVAPGQRTVVGLAVGQLATKRVVATASWYWWCWVPERCYQPALWRRLKTPRQLVGYSASGSKDGKQAGREWSRESASEVIAHIPPPPPPK